MLEIRAEIEGEKQVSAYLGTVAGGIKQWRSPLQKIAGEMHKAYQMNFDSRGALYGGWAPRKQTKPWPLLEKTGRLRKGYYDQLQGSDTLVIGNRTAYFGYHQSNQPRSRLPRRIMLKIDEARRNFIFKAFQEHIVNVLRKR